MSDKQYTGYCVKCKAKDRVMKDAELTTVKSRGGERPAATGTCEVCGTKMFKFLPKDA